MKFEVTDSEQEEDGNICMNIEKMETLTRKSEVQKIGGRGPLECNISAIRHCFNVTEFIFNRKYLTSRIFFFNFSFY